jgi:bacteriorhodopsin
MMSRTEVQRVSEEKTTEFKRYSLRLWVVLSLILSLSAIVILSKNRLVTHRWVYLAAITVPIIFTLVFRNRIVRFGPFVYVGLLLVMLGGAVLFGL